MLYIAYDRMMAPKYKYDFINRSAVLTRHIGMWENDIKDLDFTESSINIITLAKQ